jgi:hypothetical protein
MGSIPAWWWQSSYQEKSQRSSNNKRNDNQNVPIQVKNLTPMLAWENLDFVVLRRMRVSLWLIKNTKIKNNFDIYLN